MKHQEAADIMCRLISTMGSEAPGAVIMKYAAAHRLPVAQLVRLAQVYNTASTLATNEKDRGGSPHLVDVPGMALKYAAEQRKAKSTTSFMDAAPAPSPERVASFYREVPIIWSSSGPVKVAAAEEVATPPVIPPARLVNEGVRDAIDALDKTATAVMDSNELAGSLASAISRQAEPVLTWHKLAADSRALSASPLLETALLKVAKTLATYGLVLGDAPAAAGLPPMVRDRTGMVPSLLRIEGNLKTASAQWVAVVEALAKVSDNSAGVNEDQAQLREIKKLATTVQFQGEALGLLKEAAPAPQAGFPSGKVILGPWTGTNYQDDIASAAGNLAETIAPYSPAVKAVDNSADLARLTFAVPMAAGSAAAGMASNTLDLAREFTEDGEFGQYVDRRWGSKNREDVRNAATERRRIVEDTQAMAVLQDLMHRDDILSKRDPERVVEAWQTIRRAAPEVAGDKSLLRLMLRQALETQGVDIDSATAARRYEGTNGWNIQPPYSNLKSTAAPTR